MNGDKEKKAGITEMFRSDVRVYSEVAAESSLYLRYHLLSIFKGDHFPIKYKHQKRKRKRRHTMNKIKIITMRMTMTKRSRIMKVP